MWRCRDKAPRFLNLEIIWQWKVSGTSGCFTSDERTPGIQWRSKKEHWICWSRYSELSKSVAPEPEGSSSSSQEPATGLYSEPSESTPHPQPVSLRFIWIPNSQLSLDLKTDLFRAFPPKHCTFLYSPMRTTCPAHFSLSDLICLMISGDNHKLYWTREFLLLLAIEHRLSSQQFLTVLSSHIYVYDELISIASII
jgi:hypothetical protein